MATPLLIGTTTALLAILFMMMALRHSRQWSEVAIGRGDRPDELFRTLGMLKDNGVRCRLRQSGGASSMLMMGSSCTNMSLLVHQSDVVRARPLVRNIVPATTVRSVAATRARRG